MTPRPAGRSGELPGVALDPPTPATTLAESFACDLPLLALISPLRRGRMRCFCNGRLTPALRRECFARRLQRVGGQRVDRAAHEEETPGTAAHAHRCDPTALWTRRRCASRSEHLGRRPRFRAPLRALFRRPCRTAWCHNYGRSTGPTRESLRSGSDYLRREPTRTNRASLPRMRTRLH